MGSGDPAQGSYNVDVIITTQLVTISDEARRRQKDLSAGGPNTARVRTPGCGRPETETVRVPLIIGLTVNGTNGHFDAKYCYFTFT